MHKKFSPQKWIKVGKQDHTTKIKNLIHSLSKIRLQSFSIFICSYSGSTLSWSGPQLIWSLSREHWPQGRNSPCMARDGHGHTYMSMFGRSCRTQRKLTQTQWDHTKLHKDSNPSGRLLWGYFARFKLLMSWGGLRHQYRQSLRKDFKMTPS